MRWLFQILNIGMTCGFLLMVSCGLIERNVFHSEVLRKTCDSNKLGNGENCIMKTDTVFDEVITSLVGALSWFRVSRWHLRRQPLLHPDPSMQIYLKWLLKLLELADDLNGIRLVMTGAESANFRSVFGFRFQRGDLLCWLRLSLFPAVPSIIFRDSGPNSN
jgi:hypothetical protein